MIRSKMKMIKRSPIANKHAKIGLRCIKNVSYCHFIDPSYSNQTGKINRCTNCTNTVIELQMRVCNASRFV